jgi:hypothetical protein
MQQHSTPFEVHKIPLAMVNGYTDRLLSSVSTALDRLHFTAIFRKRRQTNANSVADTEPLQQADGSQSALSRQTDIELVDVEGRAQEPFSRL